MWLDCMQQITVDSSVPKQSLQLCLFRFHDVMVSCWLFDAESVSVDSAAFAPGSPVILVVMRCSILTTKSGFMSCSLAVMA